ncbi:hypothetical protein AAH991_24580 [Microbispora sp. ZYX-F-249]|uniref:Secreted protein n=1 Tax=Microbispora maris TaxID=3144104 RepID=A0ABV0AUE3_9ACTN
MPRSTRHLTGLAVLAVVAGGLAALTVPAQATPTPSVAAAPDTTPTPRPTPTARPGEVAAFSYTGLDADWGPFYSAYRNGARAMVRGRVWEDEDNGSFNVEARLYDRNSPARLCAYLRLKAKTEEETWSRTLKKCGPDGYARFSFHDWEEHVPQDLRVQVCYRDALTRTVTSCGGWWHAYRWIER